MRLALPHLEPVLVLNVGKEVEKDTAGDTARRHPMATAPRLERSAAELMQATKDIDRRFLAKVGKFPVEIVVRYDEIAPFRARRIKLLHEAAAKILIAREPPAPARRDAGQLFARRFARLQHELFRLYAEETRSLSRSVRLPGPLVPLREMIARELLMSCCGSPGRWRNEIAAATSPCPTPRSRRARKRIPADTRIPRLTAAARAMDTCNRILEA
jgi:hypothetical protein